MLKEHCNSSVQLTFLSINSWWPCRSQRQILHPIAFQSKFTIEHLVGQLEKEYGVEVDSGKDVSPDFESPTEEEE